MVEDEDQERRSVRGARLNPLEQGTEPGQGPVLPDSAQSAAGTGDEDKAEKGRVRRAIWEAKFIAGVAFRYHTKRAGVFRALVQLSGFVAFLLGATVVTDALKDHEPLQIAASIAATALGGWALFGKWGDRATQHHFACWAYADLKKKALRAKTLEDALAIKDAMLDISRDQEDPLKALDRICTIEEAIALGVEREDLEARPMLPNRIFARWTDLPYGLPPARSPE